MQFLRKTKAYILNAFLSEGVRDSEFIKMTGFLPADEYSIPPRGVALAVLLIEAFYSQSSCASRLAASIYSPSVSSVGFKSCFAMDMTSFI
jgi:hypothetical protein